MEPGADIMSWEYAMSETCTHQPLENSVKSGVLFDSHRVGQQFKALKVARRFKIMAPELLLHAVPLCTLQNQFELPPCR